ncbi:unnamed protein product [Triticum turgidum subsp. durum]|uniref:Uncharacterized protein n=1 Tax=Triticum turgidum subsp. durum TaxID=4567 RepID=A0A9R0V7S9_TRITD|nr:unnamed protein product [Triticum turgidum subsp. durum]
MEQEVVAGMKQKKCCPLRRSRKGCMKGKGGPDNQQCPFRGVRQRTWGKALYGDCARLNLSASPSQMQHPPAQGSGANGNSAPGTPCCSSNNSNSSASTPTGTPTDMDCSAWMQPSYCYSTAEAPEDFEAYVTRLPKAEDFGLEGFQEVPLEVLAEAGGGVSIWDLSIAPDMAVAAASSAAASACTVPQQPLQQPSC